MSQLEFDENTGRRLEALYTTRDVLRRRRLVHEALAVVPGERVMDLGCGPGFYTAEILEQVGSGGSVVAVDNSPAMLALAAQRCAGHDNVTFLEAGATSFEVPDGSLDAVLSVQVLEYVDDVPAALAAAFRALRPGGRVVLWDVDWATVSLNTTDVVRTDRMLRAWDEHLADPSLPRTLTAQLESAGFAGVGMEGHTFATNKFDTETYGGYLVSFIADYVARRDSVSEEETNAWLAEQHEMEQRGEFFFACIQFCFTATRPAD